MNPPGFVGPADSFLRLLCLSVLLVFVVLMSQVSLFLRVGEYGRALDIHAIVLSALEDRPCEFRLEILGAVAEIGFCGTHMGCIRHGIFTAFRQPEHAVWEFLALFVGDLVVHSGENMVFVGL